MAKLTLKLLASVYDQAQSDDRNPDTVRYTRGDVFDARNQAEYDRLIEADAAVDPEKEQERQRAELEARREALEAERARLDEQLKSVKADEKSAQPRSRQG